MAGGPENEKRDFRRAFVVGIALNGVYIVIEVVLGILSQSMALLADAGHNFSDVLGLLLAYGAYFLMNREPTSRRTYGLRKISILTALTNSIILLAVMGGVAWEAIRRFSSPVRVEGSIVIWTAIVGVFVNAVSAAFFRTGQRADLNIRGAFLHLLSDAGVSAAVALSGLGLLLTGWLWLDPVISLAVTVLIVSGTWKLLRDSFNLAIDAVPGHIDAERVRIYLEKLPQILSAHDLHIWGISTRDTALTVHLVVDRPEIDNALTEKIQKELFRQFAISHVTIQWEHRDSLPDCRSCQGVGPDPIPK